MRRWRPRLAPDVAAAARAHAPDLVAVAVLFIGASLAAGRVWRFPFDDELIALGSVERHSSAASLVAFYFNGGDIHPPLSFLMFYGWRQLGVGEAGMRLASLVMTLASLLLWHVATLTWLVRRRGGAAVEPFARLAAVLLFGLCALAVSQGDAIRWYPPFALLVALFVVPALFGADDAARLWAAVALGLAASTNFLAALVAAPYALYRYVLQRRFSPASDLAFWLIAGLFALPGLISAAAIVTHRAGGVAHTEFGVGPLRAVASDLLGFFGGDALGIGLAWLVVPAIVLFAFAAARAIDRKQRDAAGHFVLLMFAAAALMMLGGFAKPRSFLYLAPAAAALLVLFLDDLVRHRRGLAMMVLALLVAPAVGAVANIAGSRHPFKRENAIPYAAVMDFIAANTDGRVLVFSSDPVVPWVLDHAAAGGPVCASYFLLRGACFGADRTYDSIVVISGHNSESSNEAAMRRFAIETGRLTVGKNKAATLHASLDEDADLKSRLTHTPLSRAILTVDIYR